MQRIIFCCCLFFLAVLASAEGPQAVLLGDVLLAPARAVGDWMGATVAYDAKTAVVTVAGDGKVLQATLNRLAATRDGKAIMLPAPALELSGVSYLPVRALAETFDLTLTWSKNTATMSKTGTTPLTLKPIPFPRPKYWDIDTLAGLTPGDHLALAIAKWGEPYSQEASNIPGAVDYRFHPGQVELRVSVNNEKIILIEIAPGENARREDLGKIGTKRGLTLAGDPVKTYGKASQIYFDPSGDWITCEHRRRQLTLYTTFLIEDPKLIQTICLVQSNFPKKWIVQ